MLELLNDSVCLVGKRHADAIASIGRKLPLGGALFPEANFQMPLFASMSPTTRW